MRKKLAFKIFIFILYVFFLSTSYAAAITQVTVPSSNQYYSGISPALQLLIKQSLEQKQAKQALEALDAEISKNPKNPDLLYEKASIYANQDDWSNSISALKQLFLIQPNNEKAKDLFKVVSLKKQEQPRHELGFDIDEAYVSDLSSYWNYSAIHYYRLTDNGKFGGHINYANRYGSSAEQYQLEAYPKITKNMYATFSFSYANTSQILFPNLQYTIEVFVDVAHGLEFSLGQTASKFITFENQKIFNNTGTVGKYIGNSFLWFRPHFFSPKGVQFYELGWRKYFSDADHYITFLVNTGKLPDIGDLPPLDQMIIVKQTGGAINGQFSITKKLLLKSGIGYVHQLYPSGLKRNITDASLGVIWRI